MMLAAVRNGGTFFFLKFDHGSRGGRQTSRMVKERHSKV